ncbi:MAG: 3-hydroxyacyl-CoA dehydrogenase family protein [Chitinophagaceae bacterium]|nr:3-hydroxyacyl-CoA dehydrogenase [Chitinophagaceae bacterium]
MKIAVITNTELKEELLAQGLSNDVQVEWLTEVTPVPDADCYIDLLFKVEEQRIDKLINLQPALVIVNSVTGTQEELPLNFIRINAWPTFLKRTLLEASGIDVILKEKTEKLFQNFNKKVEWVPDIPGFITPRVICMIINEAYFTLEEEVSSKPEIDTAMKLGTNYPYGPFEWSEKIGLKNVYDLLIKLAQTNSRYEPSALLKKEYLLT